MPSAMKISLVITTIKPHRSGEICHTKEQLIDIIIFVEFVCNDVW